MSDKKYIWFESRFWVVLYAIVVAVMMCMQLTLGIMQGHQVVFDSKVLNDFVNGNLNLPMTVMSYGWTALISFYCCADRVVDVAKTTKLQIGQVSMGDLAKLRGMIILSLLLFAMAVAFNFLVDKDFDLSAWASAFVMTVISYVVGNKAVKASAWFGTREDADQNGIPDEAEEAYNKWKREQQKNDVDSIYINWSYFLDDPANEYWEKKYRPSSVSKE